MAFTISTNAHVATFIHLCFCICRIFFFIYRRQPIVHFQMHSTEVCLTFFHERLANFKTDKKTSRHQKVNRKFSQQIWPQRGWYYGTCDLTNKELLVYLVRGLGFTPQHKALGAWCQACLALSPVGFLLKHCRVWDIDGEKVQVHQEERDTECPAGDAVATRSLDIKLLLLGAFTQQHVEMKKSCSIEEFCWILSFCRDSWRRPCSAL